jgi:hypothetical protein
LFRRIEQSPVKLEVKRFLVSVKWVTQGFLAQKLIAHEASSCGHVVFLKPLVDRWIETSAQDGVGRGSVG